MVKTERFKDPKYVGDPINAVRIFNTKEVDEIIFLDITASKEKREPNYSRIADIASECFMPFCYGGGIRSVSQATRILSIGAEKVAINASALDNLDFISELSSQLGSQSVVVSIDVKTGLFGSFQVFDHRKGKGLGIDPISYAKTAEEKGAGEILINSVDRDGTRSGYDLKLIKEVSSSVSIPVIACGGAGAMEHFREAVVVGASAVAAGSLFVFIGKHRAVLISYPEYKEIKALFE